MVLALFMTFSFTTAEENEEYDIKAAFIYQFTNYMQEKLAISSST